MDLACDLVLKMDFHTELSYLKNFQLAECEVRPLPTFCRGHIAFIFIFSCILGMHTDTSIFCPIDVSCFLLKLAVYSSERL